MRNKLLFSTALVAAAFAASDVLAENVYTEYEAGSVITENDLGHEAGNNRISFLGDASLANDVTMGNFVTLQNQTKLTGDKKLTVMGYLTQTAAGSDISGVDLEIQKGTVYPNDNPAGDGDDTVNEGELVLGSDLTVGNVTMADGTGIFLFKGDDSANNGINKILTIAEGKTLNFVDENYIKGSEGATLAIEGDGTVVNNGNLNIQSQLSSEAKLVNNGEIAVNAQTTLNGGYESDGGYMGNETADSTINLAGDIILKNNARIVAATADDKGTVSISDAQNITLTNGSTIDAVNLTITGDEENKTQISISGNNPDAGRGEGEDNWRNNSYILGYGNSSISNAEISIGDGGHLIQGAKGTSEEPEPGTMTLANSTVDIASGGMMKSTNGSDFELNNTTINLEGRIEGTIKTAAAQGQSEGDDENTPKSVINVDKSDAYIDEIESLDELNINADTSTQRLLGADSTVTDMNIAAGKTFTLDTPEEDGTAVKLTANNVNVDGTLVVGNGATNDTNYDIENTTVNNGGTLDLGTNEYASNVTLNEGSTLAIGVANDEGGEDITNGSIASGNSLTVAGASKLAVIIADDVELGEEGSALELQDNIKNELAAEESKLTLVDNFMYDLSVDENGGITAAKEDASGIASNMTAAGASANAAGTAAAFALADGLTGQGQAIHDALSNSMQSGNASAAAKLAEDVAPSAAPVVQTVETGLLNQAYDAVSSQLSGGTVAATSEGKASGDGAFSKAAAWVRTLFNKTEIDDTSKAKGFDAETTGIALGFHKEVADNVKAGIAYAYGDTDIDGSSRDTDVESHTFMLYGEYKPSNWYVNGIASYGMSDYDEKKHTSVGTIDGSYDVETYGLQAMTGYEMNVGGYNLTPEAGLRYAHIKQDSYRDSAGQRISADDQDILTGIAGVKANKDFALDNGTILRPEVRLAMTYDLMDGDNTAIVNVGGSSYRINGEELDRFGIEAGAGVTAELNDNWDVTAGYQGRFRSDYTDHTGLLSAKYKF